VDTITYLALRKDYLRSFDLYYLFMIQNVREVCLLLLGLSFEEYCFHSVKIKYGLFQYILKY